MNKRKYRAESIRENEEYFKLRLEEFELRKKEYKLTKERYFHERMRVEGRTEDLKREMKGLYKHCIAEFNKEAEDLEARIKVADAKIKQLQEELKE